VSAGKQVWLIVHDRTGQFLKDNLQITADAREAAHFETWAAAVAYLAGLAGPNFPPCHVTDSFLHVVPEARQAGAQTRDEVISDALKRNKEQRALNKGQREVSNEPPKPRSATTQRTGAYGMGSFGVILIAALLWPAKAEAHPHHHHYRHAYTVEASSTGGAGAGAGAARPSDCYGIAWCGCWLRHKLGLADRGLNLALNWLRVGHATSAHAGAIVVWNWGRGRGHVGQIVGSCSGGYLIQSGNDGTSRTQAGTRCMSVAGAVGFRDL
jgi:hypothetical protein